MPKGKTIERKIEITVLDEGGGARSVGIKVANFNIHDLVGVLEIAKSQVIARLPEGRIEMGQGDKEMPSYVG